MRISGLDENGLGPRFGPLMVTGVLIEAENESRALLSNHSGPVDDSKRIFKRDPKSYAKGEAIALGILRNAGMNPVDTEDLRRELGLPEDLPLPRTRLPIWCSDGELPLMGIRVLGIATRAISPRELNEANKFSRTVSSMIEIGQKLAPSDLCVLGKVGGRRFYSSFLWARLGEETLIISEKHEESRYIAGSREWRFVQDADRLWLPVAMAGIIGKYIRELSMLELNARAGFESPIPYCSGYPGDPKTPELEIALRRLVGDPWLEKRGR
ncbi:MAG: hypothetical protein ABIM88_00760 [candidate division WOR-3 bacterium]